MDRRPPIHAPGRGTRLVSGLALALALALAPARARAEEERAAPPDQVHVLQARSGATSAVSGTVTADKLAGVTVRVGAQDRTFDPAEVKLVVWGAVPPAFQEAQQYEKRGDYENAVAKYKVAAGDAAARGVVQAAARLGAAEALFRWGAREPARFRESALEAERYLQAYPESRDVPRARLLRARAMLLSGDPTAAAALYRALWEETRVEVPKGYDRLQGLEAGRDALRALIAMGDSLAAREVAGTLGTQTTALLAELAPDDPARRRVLQVQTEAQLAEGFVLLAAGQSRQALSFFESRIKSQNGQAADTDTALALGYAESLLAEKRPREAQVWFARVSALEPADRDRIARAMVGLAEGGRALGDTSASLAAGTWLDEVLRSYGDTPAAARARELKGA